MKLNLTVFYILCRIVLPMLTIIFLLTPVFAGGKPPQSPQFDLIIRLILITFFCTNYWQLPNSKLFDPRSEKWMPITEAILKEPASLKMRYFFIALGYTVFVFLFTLFAFTNLIPDFRSYRFIASGINAFIFFIAFALHYPKFQGLEEI